jgi:hypothetical protein
MDAVPEEERGNVALMDDLVRNSVVGGKVISVLEDFLVTNTDCYDTNYHLLSKQADAHTALWLRDLQARMVADGLWEVAQ